MKMSVAFHSTPPLSLTDEETSFLFDSAVAPSPGIASQRAIVRLASTLALPHQRIRLCPSASAGLAACGLIVKNTTKIDNALVIVPSWGYCTAVSAFTRVGLTPLFVDCDACGCMSLEQVQCAIQAHGEQICAIVLIHYGGVLTSDTLKVAALCRERGWLVIEDAAHAVGTKGACSVGDLAVVSFHSTKNVSVGEGGALVVNKEELWRHAQMVCDKGTNRIDFVAGKVAKYEWVCDGSSFIMSEMMCALLWARLRTTADITTTRMRLWHRYSSRLRDAHPSIVFSSVSDTAEQCAHIVFVTLPSQGMRTDVVRLMADENISLVEHYAPLHSSPQGMRLGRCLEGALFPNTMMMAKRSIRLPLHTAMTEAVVDHVVDHLIRVVESLTDAKTADNR